MIEFRHLRYFIAVAEHLNFSRAALALETAQPSLSQQIRQLERSIGFALFERKSRSITLTATGLEFLSEARFLVARLDLAVAHAREAGRGARGELRIAYTASTMMAHLPSVIRAFRADHTNVRMKLFAMTPSAVMEALDKREVDIGVLLQHSEIQQFSTIETHHFGSLELAAVVPEGHSLAKHATISIEEIGDATLILYARHLSDIQDAVLALCRARNFRPTRIEEVSRVETVLGLVAAGEGISIIPDVYATLNFQGVTFTKLSPAPEPFSIIVARHRNAHSPLAAAFIATYER